MPPTSPDYQSFDLAIQSTLEGYLAHVHASPAGEAKILLPDGPDERELADFLTYIDQALAEIEADPSGDQASALADECHLFGASLFKTIFADDVLSLWRTSLAAVNGGQGLRLRLRLTDAPELNSWPWEFLYDPVVDSYLALTVKTPNMRYLEMPVAIEPLQTQPPLRILVIAPNPTDLPELAVDKELQKLDQGLKQYELSVMASRRATELPPYDPRQYFNLGLGYLALGETQAARKSYLAGIDAANAPENAIRRTGRLEEGIGDLKDAQNAQADPAARAQEFIARLEAELADEIP